MAVQPFLCWTWSEIPEDRFSHDAAHFFQQDEEISTLKQKLGESRKTAENLQISRAETINRLTQSLEESQKRCRNLLESSKFRPQGHKTFYAQHEIYHAHKC